MMWKWFVIQILLFPILVGASTPYDDSFRLYATGTAPTGLAAEFAADIDFKYYGILTPARQTFIDVIVNTQVSNAGQSPQPLLTILIGAPGSGKSYAVDYLREKGFFDGSQSGLISADRFKENFKEYQILLRTRPDLAAHIFIANHFTLTI